MKEEEWIIVTSFKSGGTAYWDVRRDQSSGLVPHRTSSFGCESREAAIYAADGLRQVGFIDDYEVEKLPPKPRLKVQRQNA